MTRCAVVILGLILVATYATSASIQRVKRQNFKPLGACTVSHQEIQELIQLTKNMQTAMQNVQIDTRSGFDEEAANRDRCYKQLATFRGSVQDVIRDYKSIDRNSMTEAQYERAKARYQTEIQRLLRKIDNLKRDIEDGYREEVEQLRKNMQNFKVELDDNMSLLEKERARSRSAFIRLCIANVRAGRIKDAAEDFRGLDGLPYEHVVTEVYENKPENADLVMNFLEAIDLKFEPVRGYEVLYRLMKQNNQLNGSLGRRLLIQLQALASAEDENFRRASALLRSYKQDVHE